MKAAEALFAERGYGDVGVAELCERIGIAPPSLYSAWGSKLGLFEAALERYAQRIGARFGTVVTEATGRDVLWERLLREAARLYTGAPGRGCLALESGGAADVEVRTLAGRHAERTRRALAERLETLGLSASEADADSRALLLALRGVSASARAGVGRAALLRDVDALLVRAAGARR